MKKKLFVSNLDFEVTAEELRAMFETVGSTLSVVVALDRETKRSRGFAFVEMEDSEAADIAIKTLNGKTFNGRPIKVVEDRGKTNVPVGPVESAGGKKFEPLPPIQRMYLFKRKKRGDPYVLTDDLDVDYRDLPRICGYVSDRGRIHSRRMTGLCAKNQRKVSKALKRAQSLGLAQIGY